MTTTTNGARISPAEAHAKMRDEGFVYVDVRTAEEFAAGHPAGAVNVPLMKVLGGAAEPGFVGDVEAKVGGKAVGIVVGCKAGGRSAKAAQLLVGAGFVKVADQRAGWDGIRGAFGEVEEVGWSKAGLPVE